MTYTCACCQGIFEQGWSDEEAEREAQNLWGVKGAISDPRMVEVCEDCFQLIHPGKFPELKDKAIEELGK